MVFIHPEESDSSRKTSIEDIPKRSLWKRFTGPPRWTPPSCRRVPGRDFPFTRSFVVLCAFASGITAANLYYTYPVLNKAAEDFGVSNQRASLIPQLLQAGYGGGILFLCPLGDVFRLRPLILTLLTLTTASWLGLCLATDFLAFSALSFVTGFVTVSPQLLLPLVDRLAPPSQKATAVSVVLAGMMMGLAVPRVVTGIATQYTAWRNIYWVALGLQCVLVAAVWALFPDFPAVGNNHNNNNNESRSKLTRYLTTLRTIINLTLTTPTLLHACLIAFLTNASLASFWTTSTFHLSSTPLLFSPLQLGLFSLIAVGTTCLIPLYTHLVISRFVTYFSSAIGVSYGILNICLDSFLLSSSSLGNHKNGMVIAGATIQALGVDFGLQVASVAYRTAVYRDMPLDANKANVMFTACAFIGQLVGTSGGNAVYASFSLEKGWMGVGIWNLALAAAALVVVLARGPGEEGWVGWTGGWGIRLRRGEEGRGEGGEKGQDV